MAASLKNLELTTSQKKCLVAYQKHVERHGVPPTRRGLAETLGVYPNAVTRMLQGLQEKGFIQMKPRPNPLTFIRLRSKAKEVVAKKAASKKPARRKVASK